MPISASLHNKTLDKLAKVEEELKQYKATTNDIYTSLGIQEQTIAQLNKDKDDYAKANYELRSRLQAVEKDLQRIALAYETIRSAVHLTSAQLGIEEINPAITSSITSLVKTNQTNNQEIK